VQPSAEPSASFSPLCSKHLATPGCRERKENAASSPGRYFIMFVGDGCSGVRRKDLSKRGTVVPFLCCKVVAVLTGCHLEWSTPYYY